MRYLDRVIAGELPTPDEWNDHLIAFHREYAVSTADSMSLLRTARGETSYDVLTARLNAWAPDARDVLDLGCGDGTLLAQIAGIFGPGVRLTGVDLCDAQIARARKNLPGVSFLCGDATVVKMGQNAYDAVVAHLSLMAMARVGTVLQRAHSALRPSGLLAFVCEDPLAGDTIFGLMASAMALLRDRLPNFEPLVPGRASIEHDEILLELLGDAGFATITIERFCLHGMLTADQLWRFVEQTYPLGLLESSLRLDLRGAILAVGGSPEFTETSLALRLVCAYA